MTIEQYKQFNLVARGKAVPSNPSGYGLASWDFANAYLDTVWIDSTFSDSLKTVIEEDINHIYNRIPFAPENRLVLHRQQSGEQLPVNEQGNPLPGNVLGLYQTGNPTGVAIDYNQDGTIDAGIFTLPNYFSRGVVYQEFLTAITIPNNIEAGCPYITPSMSVLHDGTTLNESSDLDNKLVRTALNTPSGLEPEYILSISPQQFYLSKNVNSSN